MESLKCDLFEPGMTPLHRAGLGGLVATLRKIEKNEPPPLLWNIDDRSVTFEWKKEQERKMFFQFLFDYAFQLKDGIIHLPGQYGDVEPPLEVKASLHEGLLLSFYDHGPTSRGSKTAVEKIYEVDGNPISYRYLPLSWYKHQRDGSKLLSESLRGQTGLTRTLFPGAVQRHASYNTSQITQPATLLLPLLFAPVGVMALKAGGKRVKVRRARKFKPGAALLIPDLKSLSEVQYLLPNFLPRTARDCQIANVADAALQAELRLRSRNLLTHETISSLRCVWCCPTDWNARLQPPSTVTEISIDVADATLDQFEIAMQTLPPPSPRQNRKSEYFWPRGYVRPLVAENLTSGRPWFTGFSRLMSGQDPISNKPIRNYLYLERKGLAAMAQRIAWDTPGEETIIRAVHEAMRCRYGRIAAENARNQVAMRKRMTREYERQRLAFVGTKTADALRYALADLWSRAGSNSVLRRAWPQILPLLSDEKWQTSRDLALIALASYKGKEQEHIDLTETEENTETEE